jgi:hypothetical protein
MSFQVFRRKACALRRPPGRTVASSAGGSLRTPRPLRPRDLVPLIGFVVPTVVMGYGVVIPRSCIAGVNDLTIGVATSIIGACVTYVVGLRRALRQ